MESVQVGVCRAFLRHMAQPYPLSAALRLGPSMLADASLCWSHVVRTLGIDSKTCALEPLLVRRKMIEQSQTQQQASSSKVAEPSKKASIEEVSPPSSKKLASAAPTLPANPSMEDAALQSEGNDAPLDSTGSIPVVSKRELSPCAQMPKGKHPALEVRQPPPSPEDRASA